MKITILTKLKLWVVDHAINKQFYQLHHTPIEFYTQTINYFLASVGSYEELLERSKGLGVDTTIKSLRELYIKRQELLN